jgi:hypothetical protein
MSRLIVLAGQRAIRSHQMDKESQVVRRRATRPPGERYETFLGNLDYRLLQPVADNVQHLNARPLL